MKPSIEDKITRARSLRMRRLGLAAAASNVTVVIAFLAVLAGYLPLQAAAIYAGLVAACCSGFYALFHANLNERFRDPTMSGAQLVLAGLCISYLVYEGADTRTGFMAMYLMAFMFAMFALELRGIVKLAIFYVACYVGVVELSLFMRPETVALGGEAVRATTFAVLLAWMAIMGQHINGLRMHLRGSNEKLRQAVSRYEHIVEMSSDWYWEQDEHLRFTRVDGRLRALFGMEPAKLLGKTRWEAGYGQFPPGFWDEHIHTLENRQAFRDFEIVRKDDQGRVVHAALTSGQPIFDDEGRFLGYRGVGRDITERRQMEETIARMAAYDELTGLPNARLLSHQLARSIAEAQRAGRGFCVLYCDLDGFKPVNDSLGHLAGDALLAAVALRLTTTLRESDMVARVGGDEFVALGNTCVNEEDAARFAERIRASLSTPFPINGRDARISCSIGIARYPQDGADARTLLEKADQAMYLAKRSRASAPAVPMLKVVAPG